MPRNLRIEFEGALYHVINRGDFSCDLAKSDGAAEAVLVPRLVAWESERGRELRDAGASVA
jgi:hypothetical protein